MNKLSYIYDDGGRSEYFDHSHVGDCVVRAFAIASKSDYMDVYRLATHISYIRNEEEMFSFATPSLQLIGKIYGFSFKPIKKKKRKKIEAAYELYGDGVYTLTYEEEVGVSHSVAIVDGVVRDTWDCRKEDNPKVYCVYTLDKYHIK